MLRKVLAASGPLVRLAAPCFSCAHNGTGARAGGVLSIWFEKGVLGVVRHSPCVPGSGTWLGVYCVTVVCCWSAAWDGAVAGIVARWSLGCFWDVFGMISGCPQLSQLGGIGDRAFSFLSGKPNHTPAPGESQLPLAGCTCHCQPTRPGRTGTRLQYIGCKPPIGSLSETYPSL